MQRTASQVVCHSCDSYLREMTGAIWFPGLRLHRSYSLVSSLVAAQELVFLVCLLLLLQNTFSLTLLPVFLIGMRLYTFFPLPNIPSWTWTSNCSVCGVFIIRSIYQEPDYSGKLSTECTIIHCRLRWVWKIAMSIDQVTYKIYFSNTLLQLWIENHFYITIWHKVHDAFL